MRCSSSLAKACLENPGEITLSSWKELRRSNVSTESTAADTIHTHIVADASHNALEAKKQINNIIITQRTKRHPSIKLIWQVTFDLLLIDQIIDLSHLDISIAESHKWEIDFSSTLSLLLVLAILNRLSFTAKSFSTHGLSQGFILYPKPLPSPLIGPQSHGSNNTSHI